MATLTEGKHPEEFLLSEANGTRSRETATLSSGQNLTDGQVLQLNGSGELIAKDTALNTEGDVTTPVEGVLIGNWDASATGTNADIPNVPYIKRDAEVKEAAMTFPAGANPKAATIRDLERVGIIVR